MNQAGGNDLLVAARSALLDALEALREQIDAVVVVGAQAIYLHTGSAPVALAEATKDCDLALDTRARVAGPAALLVAKLHKLGERQAKPGRLVDKDAHDIYRLLVAIPTDQLAPTLGQLRTDKLAGPVTETALAYLDELFAGADALGSVMAGRAEEGIGDPKIVSASVAALAEDLVGAVG